MPVRRRDSETAASPPPTKRCKHCDESRSSCGGGESWRVTLDHDLVETLSAIYPEWFLPQPRLPPASPRPAPPYSPAEEMAGREASCSSGSGGGSPPHPPRVSPPKVVVDDSPLQPAMGKHKESLKVKLMMRRPINQLVEQGIMPPSKTPAVFFEQYKQLERAKTGDLLKAKIQRRPDRQELERRHILEQESHVDPSLAEKQRMLKKARLADQLNDQLSHRPGPLELIKKNILHTEETIETAVKSGVLAFKATSEGATGRPQHPSQYCGPPEEISPSPSPPSTLSPVSVPSPPQHPAPGKDKKKKSKPKQQPKARFKFHEYKGPPNAQKPASPQGSVQTPYELLLQQQQLLLQLMMPASPAMSVASVTSDSSDSHAPPPPPLPPTPAQTLLPSRFEDMKVSDLRAECKRRNLRVSGPKPQLLDRLRPYLVEKQIKQEEPRSPASVTSVSSISSVDVKPKIEPQETVTSTTTTTDMTHSLEELERKLEASRQQLEQMRREAANAPASDQSRRLLQAHLCVTQLRAQLDALQQPQNNQPPPQRYVIAASELFSPGGENNNQAKVGNPAYILNGVKVVPIAILPSYEPERPTPPPPPPLPTPTAHELSEDSQIMDDVLELLVENGELPASAVDDSTANIDTTFLDADIFSPEDVLNSGVLDTNARDTLAADELQRELDHIQQEIMSGTQENDRGPDIDPDLSVDMLTNDGYHTGFGNTDSNEDTDFLTGLLSSAGDRHTAMETDEAPERTSVTPLTNGDILEPARPNFDDMDDLSLPSFQHEDSRQDTFEERPCELDLKEFGIDLSPAMHVDGYDYMDTQLIPNLFGRGHVPQCDPLLGGVVSHPAPRPASKHYSWDRIEFDAT